MKNEEPQVCIDCQDVIRHDGVLFTQLVNYPGELIPLFDSEANILAAQLTGEDVMDINLKASSPPCHTEMTLP